MKHTLALFHHLINDIPPLFPEEKKQKMEQTAVSLENDRQATMEQIENAMVRYGREVWPYGRAYREFYAAVEAELGENFLSPKLPAGAANRYQEFKKYGGTLADLRSGRSARFFSLEERNLLGIALVDARKELRNYADRMVAGAEQRRYLSRVEVFAEILKNIERALNILRALADKENDHPELAREIRGRVKNFEYGLCLLGPEVDFGSVRQSVEFFSDRRQHLNMMKGAHRAVTVDWFGDEDTRK